MSEEQGKRCLRNAMTWGAGDWRACQKSELGGLLLIDEVKAPKRQKSFHWCIHWMVLERDDVCWWRLRLYRNRRTLESKKEAAGSWSYGIPYRDSNDICVYSVINKLSSWKFDVLLSYRYRNTVFIRIIYVLAHCSHFLLLKEILWKEKMSIKNIRTLI